MFTTATTLRVCVLLFVLALVPLSGARAQEALTGSSNSMPATLSLPEMNKQGPTWIALDAAYQPNGDLRPDDELPPATRVALRAAMRSRPATATGCVQWRSSRHPAPGRADLGSALAEAKSILKATVTGISPGLWYGSFGNLVRVQLDEVLKDSGSRQPLREHYVFVRAGEISIQGRRFCIEDREYPKQLPDVGDHVLLLSDWWDPNHPILTTDGGSGFIGLTGEGRTLVPQRYLRAESSLADSSVDDFLAQVRNTLGGSR